MKVNELMITKGSRGDKSVIWTLSDMYVNWCQIVVGNPEYLERIYSGGGVKLHKQLPNKCSNRDDKPTSIETKKNPCPCPTPKEGTSVNATYADSGAMITKGPCSKAEYEQWQRLIDLVELKKKCAELQKRLQNETFYKCRMAASRSCRKQVFDCPCIPRNSDAYVTGKPAIKDGGGRKDSKKGKDGKSGKSGKNDKGGKGKKDGIDRVDGRGRGKKIAGAQSDNCIEYKLSMDDKKSTRENMDTKIFTFGTEPFCFEGSCFRPRMCGEKHFYKNGMIAAIFDCDGTGTIYYPNGEEAITLTKGKLGCRLKVMSKTGHDQSGQYFRSVPIAIFDTKGNGVVYDQHGKIRLNYDQAEGIMYDTPSGAPARWQWLMYSLVKSRREQLQGVKEDAPDDEEDLEEGIDQADVTSPRKSTTKQRLSKSKKSKKAKEPAKKKTATKQSNPNKGTISKHILYDKSKQEDYKSNELEEWANLLEKVVNTAAIQIKPVAMKLNDYITLRIQKQDHIHMEFKSYPLHFHINLGIKLDPKSIERIDKLIVPQAQISAVPCYFELLHKRTKSLRNLHSSLEAIRKDNISEEKIKFIKKAKLMGVLKYITQIAMKKLNQDEEKLTKIFFKCQ